MDQMDPVAVVDELQHYFLERLDKEGKKLRNSSSMSEIELETSFAELKHQAFSLEKFIESTDDNHRLIQKIDDNPIVKEAFSDLYKIQEDFIFKFMTNQWKQQKVADEIQTMESNINKN